MAGNICEKVTRNSGSILIGQTKPAEKTMGNEVNNINTVTSSGRGNNKPIQRPKAMVANKNGMIN